MEYKMDFSKQKTQRLEHVDLSRKGSVDEALQDLVSIINSMPQYFTTSSCSGRIIVVENASSKVQKKGCKWLHVSHKSVQVTEIVESLQSTTDEAVMKFEPMVMHMQCEALEDARRMHQAAVAAGFRNSGITVGNKGKIMMAVRSTHSLEVPLSSHGELLVSQKYLEFLTDSANCKMEENFSRIHRFHENVKLLAKDCSSLATKEEKCKKSQKKSSGHEKKVVAQQPQDDSNTNTNTVSNSDEDVMSLFVFDDT